MLHPQARALLDLMTERGVPPTHTLSVAEARSYYRERRHITQPVPPPIDTVRALTAEGPHGPIPLRLYRHGEGSSPCPALVYFHGGGWVIGDLDTHDTLCRQLALASGCVVVSVDYRMGPEHPFPAAVDDAVAATRWLAAQAGALGLDATRLAVGGDSAGGNLAAVVALALRGERPLAFQLLIYPATDQHPTHASRQRNAQGYLLTEDTMRWFHDHYLTDPALVDDWRASPLRHPDLSGLPPALVLTAGYDPLRDEGVAYAQRLSEAGVRASLQSFERQIHGFILMGRVIDEANEAVALCADALRRALTT
jgi:acetyl esterase